MKKLIDERNELYAEDVRLVKNLMKREFPEEFPELLKWALQMLYFDGKQWIEICRIDNYLHEGDLGSHIHTYKRKEVKYITISFHHADALIKKISKKILIEAFHKHIDFGEDIDEN